MDSISTGIWWRPSNQANVSCWIVTSRLISFNTDIDCVQSGKLLGKTLHFFCTMGFVINTVPLELEQMGLKLLHWTQWQDFHYLQVYITKSFKTRCFPMAWSHYWLNLRWRSWMWVETSFIDHQLASLQCRE